MLGIHHDTHYSIRIALSLANSVCRGSLGHTEKDAHRIDGFRRCAISCGTGSMARQDVRRLCAEYNPRKAMGSLHCPGITPEPLEQSRCDPGDCYCFVRAVVFSCCLLDC